MRHCVAGRASVRALAGAWLSLGLWGGACSTVASESHDAAADAPVPASDAGRPRPRLLRSTPALSAADVYPAPLFSGEGEEVIVELEFSAAMQLEAELELVPIAPQGHVRPVAEVRWSPERTRASLFVRGDFAEPHPLLDRTTYALDLSPFVDARGATVEPDIGLDDGRLTFTTGRFDALLNHSCGHTFFGPFASVGAHETRHARAPNVSVTHTQYTVTLPLLGAQYEGWVWVQFAVGGTYHFYLDVSIPVSVWRSGAETVVPVVPVANACPGIGFVAAFDAAIDEQLFFRIGPQAQPNLELIVELVPTVESP